MSLPFDGFKAAQTGLVDMGNISFYNTGATPIFNPFELAQSSVPVKACRQLLGYTGVIRKRTPV